MRLLNNWTIWTLTAACVTTAIAITTAVQPVPCVPAVRVSLVQVVIVRTGNQFAIDLKR